MSIICCALGGAGFGGSPLQPHASGALLKLLRNIHLSKKKIIKEEVDGRCDKRKMNTGAAFQRLAGVGRLRRLTN